MVGVPGKYKGCETCRRRRVKCSMERPFCSKCINSGRQCEGFERDRVFITGTPQDRGRVASHPKKGPPSRRTTPRPEGNASPRNEGSASQGSASPNADSDISSSSGSGLTPVRPFTSAWTDYLRLSSNGVEWSVLLSALQTNLQSVLRMPLEASNTNNFMISLPLYVPTELQPAMTEADLDVKAHCFVHLRTPTDTEDSAENHCAFFFEHNFSTVPSIGGASWELSVDEMSLVKRMGPGYFTSFPNHHYFVRVYRPLAVTLALLSRRNTFLMAPEWRATPWEIHPKSLLDELFDIALFLPLIFEQTDQILPAQATVERRGKAVELLQSCLALESRFHHWLELASAGTQSHPLPYWVEELVSPGTELSFANSYTFKDAFTALLYLHYWMVQILFHRCIDGLNRAIFQPVVDSFPDMWPDLPPNLQIDPVQYQQGRELAANICRGLDSALNSTVQPDMLLGPMTVALDFYREMNTTSPDGLLEIMWLEAFRGRLVAKGQHVANVLQGPKWTEVANF